MKIELNTTITLELTFREANILWHFLDVAMEQPEIDQLDKSDPANIRIIMDALAKHVDILEQGE